MVNTPEKMTYKRGDKVFAKVKGYVPWPAKITNYLGKNKFSVLFYGTKQTGTIHQKDLVFYQEYKNSYVHKYIKKTNYVDAVKQIENDLKNENVDSKFVGFKNYKKPKHDLEIITKKMLNNLILYAEHVKKNPDIFMAKPVEARKTSEKDIYAFKLPSGKVCGVKLYRNWPPKHKNEYERTLYDEKIAKAAFKAETLLTTEKKPFEEIEMEVVADIEITERDLNSISSLKDLGIDVQKRKIARLIAESKLLEWDCKIRSSLDVDSATLDTALDTLKEFQVLEALDALMFKKYPHVLDNLKKLREYSGNIGEWNMNDSQLEIFEQKAADIRSEASSIYRILQSLFPIDPENEFWNSFLEIVSDFKLKCKGLTERQVSELCDEPDSRQAFFDML